MGRAGDRRRRRGRRGARSSASRSGSASRSCCSRSARSPRGVPRPVAIPTVDLRVAEPRAARPLDAACGGCSPPRWRCVPVLRAATLGRRARAGHRRRARLAGGDRRAPLGRSWSPGSARCGRGCRSGRCSRAARPRAACRSARRARRRAARRSRRSLLAVFVPLLMSADAAFAQLLEDAVPTGWASTEPFARVARAARSWSPAAARWCTPACARRSPRRGRRGFALGAVECADRARRARRRCSPRSSRCSSRRCSAASAHVLDTAGLTYAEYARSGFAQLLAVAALTFAVIAAARRWAAAAAAAALLAALCVLTLVVLASALKRLGLYEETYGFTRLRLRRARRAAVPRRAVLPGAGRALGRVAAAGDRGRHRRRRCCCSRSPTPSAGSPSTTSTATSGRARIDVATYLADARRRTRRRRSRGVPTAAAAVRRRRRPRRVQPRAGPPRDERVLTAEQQLQRVAILGVPAGDARDAVDERVERRAPRPVAVEERGAAQQPPHDQRRRVDPGHDRLELQARALEQALEAVGREVHASSGRGRARGATSSRRTRRPGLQHARDVGDQLVRALDVLEHLLGEDDVDARVLERQRTPSKIRSSTSARVSYSESPTSTPIQRTVGSAARKASTESPRPQPRSTTSRAGARGEQGRDEVAPRAPAPTSASGAPVAAGCGDRHPAGGDRTSRSILGACGRSTNRSGRTRRPIPSRTRGSAAARCCWPRRGPGERVLDLGCGAGRFLAALRDAGADPVGVEIAEAAAERARANVPGADVRLARARRLAPVRPRRGRPRLVLGGARAHPGRRARAATRSGACSSAAGGCC